MVYGVALRVVRDPTAAADITQEVFAGFWEHPEGFDPGRGRLRSWMGMLAHRRTVDWVRHEQVRRRTVVTQAQLAPPPLPNAEEAAMTALAASSVRSALEVVPESQRAVIVMAYFEGRPGREISRLLGIPLGTVKSRMRAGLLRVAEELRAAGISPEA
jgi:RNA polymerase sigma-70 factor (ECF subfamily)